MKRTTLALSLLVACSAFAAPGDGDLWEVTSQMKVEGMPPGYQMPARTNEVCRAKVWDKPPVAADDQRKCEFVDFKNTAGTSTWKMHCAGPPPIDGDGEITRTGDTYKGVINMSSEQGVMKMILSGRRIGDCDAEAAVAQRDAQMARVQAQIAAGQKVADDAREQACKGTAEAMSPTHLDQQAAVCDPAKYKPVLCAKAASDEGFKELKKRPKDAENGLAAVAAYCGMDVAAKEKDLCAKAAAGESDLDYVARFCPDEAAPIAQRECAGRTYTALAGTKYAPFCGTYAAAHPMPGASPAPESTKTKAKKTLKSIFGK